MTQAVDEKPISKESQAAAAARVVRFGIFEVDLQARELRKRGLRVKLQEKPFQILELLLERAGELVTRKEVAERLWPGVHVAYDRSLNTAVNVLRRALGDTPRNPRFLETRSGLGYRFIAPVEKNRPAQVNPGAAHAIDSVAVLSFTNVSEDASLDFLADSIAERTISTLSKSNGIRVASRSSVHRFRGPDFNVSAIGKELSVRAVLTGEIVRNDHRVSVSVELVDASTGWRLWGERYDTAESASTGIETELAGAIASGLRSHLERLKAARVPVAGSIEAHRDYQIGRFFQAKMTDDALRKSIAYFESALVEEPGYPFAWCGLADTYALFAFVDIMPAAEAGVRARDFASRAIDAATELAESHASMAFVRSLFDRDWTSAEAEYRRALHLNPDLASAHHGYARLLSRLGRTDEAIAEIRRAQALDPLSLVINADIAWALYMARDFEGALQQAWKTLALEPRFALAQHALGLANQQLGYTEEAIVEFRNACVCSGNHPGAVAALVYALAGAGQLDEAMSVYRDLEQMRQLRHVSPYWLAIARAGLGRCEPCFDALEQALGCGDVWLAWLNVEPRFDPLRSHPRFEQLLARLRLAPLKAATPTSS